MNEIRFKVTVNKLEVENNIFSTAGSVNFDSCVFTFDSTWDDFEKYALFTFNNEDTVKVDITNNRCNIPGLCMNYEGILRISVLGFNYSGVLITTNAVGHKIEEGVNDAKSWLKSD